MRRRTVLIAAVALAAASLSLLAASPCLPLRRALLASRPRRIPVTPARDAVFTSTRQVTRLAVGPDGAVWVGTMGGVLRRDRDGTWRKFTRRDGLPSHEVRGFVVDGGELIAVFPRAAAVWRDGSWRPEPAARALPNTGLCDRQTCAAVWRGQPCVATVAGLRVREGKAWRLVPLPPSRGTHISALLPHGETLWAALFGDGLWAFDGQAWRPVEIALPPDAREITALAAAGGTLWLGTRRSGVWECDGKSWTQHLQPDEPYDHNCQSLAIYRGDLYVSTLEDGLAVRTPAGWQHVTDALLSSSAPRQMVEFAGALYLRHGNGKVDRRDGGQWARDVCSGLPRKQAMALASDGQRLYVAQWGGWSEFDGRTWTHCLKLPELQGVAITALCPAGETLWIGTQGHGLAEVDRASGRLRWHDERHGLPDDWVTALAVGHSSLMAGTFVGGLAVLDGPRWTALAELSGQNVTALAPDGAGGMFVGTRTGVWHRARDGALVSLNRRLPFLDHETQALCAVDGGLWVGTRTGLYFLPCASWKSMLPAAGIP